MRPFTLAQPQESPTRTHFVRATPPPRRSGESRNPVPRLLDSGFRRDHYGLVRPHKVDENGGRPPHRRPAPYQVRGRSYARGRRWIPAQGRNDVFGRLPAIFIATWSLGGLLYLEIKWVRVRKRAGQERPRIRKTRYLRAAPPVSALPASRRSKDPPTYGRCCGPRPGRRWSENRSPRSRSRCSPCPAPRRR